MKIFILIVVTHVYSGSVVSFQEWTSFEKCESAKAVVLAAGAKHGNGIAAECKER